MTAQIEVVGLGPGSPELLTVESLRVLESAADVIVRTRHHPSVEQLDPDRRWVDCDDLYARSSFDDVYAAVVDRVLQAASGGVVYAVPGHPLVAERTVELLLAAATERGISTRVLPALSYADAAAAALGLDFSRVQLCDALDLRIDVQRPALVSQLYDRDTAAGLKLQLLDAYPDSHPVTLLRSLGTPGEAIEHLELCDLDRKATGYLDALYVPPLPPTDDVRRFDGLFAIVERLHAPDGCPWDREQTHVSLRSHLLEESYEALEAIDSGDAGRLTEELGDVLLQVLMHAEVARRSGEFTFADIAEHISTKLVRRHPHVFGEVSATTAEEVYRNWDALKRAEKPRDSILDGVPASLPALAASQAIQGRARRAGFDWPGIEGPLEKLREEIGEFARAGQPSEREEEFGDIAFVLANIAQRLDVDAEQALRKANAKFRRRFGEVERLAREAGLELQDLDLAGLDELWDQAKALERQGQL